MLYELTAHLFFETEDPITDIKDKILDHFPDAKVINPDSITIEYSSADVIENHHDEDPNAPCTLMYHIDNQPD